jgi:hypothetical protein
VMDSKPSCHNFLDKLSWTLSQSLVDFSVADQKLFISDPAPAPTFQKVYDPLHLQLCVICVLSVLCSKSSILTMISQFF